MKLTTKDFEKVLNIGILLTVEKDRNRLLDQIVTNGMEITHCDACTFYLYEDDKLYFTVMKTLSQGVDRGGTGEPITDIPPVPFKEENVCAYTAIHREVVNIADVYTSDKFDFSGPKRYDALTGFRTTSMLVIPVEDNRGELIGVLQMMNAQDENGAVIPFAEEYEIIIRSLGSLAAVALSNIRYLQEIKDLMHSFVEAMATAIDARTPYNGSHTRNVAKYAVMIANAMNQFSEDELECIELAALLHDIGKMIIPKSIMNRATRLDQDINALRDRYALIESVWEIAFLKKEITQETYENEVNYLKNALSFIEGIDGKGFLPDNDLERVREIASKSVTKADGLILPYLTERELTCLSIRKGTLTDADRRQMESHVEMTVKILSKVHFNKFYAKVPTWAGNHHEYVDGTGYPAKLKGDELDVESRILTVADIYDALTADDRPYKAAIPMDRALSILHSMVEEGKLDGSLVDILEQEVTKA